MRAKIAQKPIAQRLRPGDPIWTQRPRPGGPRRTKTWFMRGELVPRIVEDTYCVKVGDQKFREKHESPIRAREPDIRGKHVSLDYTAHKPDWNNDYA